MRGFQPKISMECANKPASVGLKRSWGWKQDSTKRILAKPHQPSSKGVYQLRHPTRKLGPWRMPFPSVNWDFLCSSSQVCSNLPRTGIWAHPSPARLPDQWLKSGHSTRTLGRVAIFLPMLLSRELLFLTPIG